MNKYIFFDVGAHNGKSSLHLVNNPNAIVYAFEPVPEYFNLLQQESIKYPNYKVYNKAVSDYTGKASFNICGIGRASQCSSLLEFSDKSKLEEHWRGYNNFNYTQKIDVDVITLEQFIEEYNIDHIDYLHCDAQGCDLKVLKSLGNYINIVKEGVVETARNEEVKLYKNQETYSDVEEFLKNNGFEIVEVRSNNSLETEFNVFFKRK